MSDLRTQLQEIYEQAGRLTPRMVVDTARPEDHPLHSRFEWDDEVAGEKYREVQARDLIQSVKIKYRSGDREEEVRYFVSVKREDGYSYTPSEEVAQDEILSTIVLREMEREWRVLHARYGHFAEFVEMVRSGVG